MKNIIWLLLILLGAGCASTKPNPQSIDWNARIGNYTYEQALADFGRPDLVGESSGGRFAEWVIQRSPRMSFGFGVGGGSFGRHGGAGVGVGTDVSPSAHGEYLRLSFDEASRLRDWTFQKN